MSIGTTPSGSQVQRKYSIGHALWLIAFIFVMAAVMFAAAMYMAL